MGKGRGQKTIPAVQTAFERLSPQHKKFVVEFLGGFNATRAYIAAGYSRNGADVSASRLLGNARIAAAVREALEAQGITAGRIKIGMAGIAFGNEPSKIVTGPNGHSEQDRLAALRELARVVGLITEKHEVTQDTAIKVMFDESDPRKLLDKVSRASEAKREEARGGAADGESG